jgi:hypothetical protein
MKKLILLFSAALFFAATSSAQKSGTTGNLDWRLDEAGVLVISGIGEMPDYSYPDFAPWSHLSDIIYDVIIKEGVTDIGNYAFYDHNWLFSVDIPQSVEHIGEVAFANCVALTSVYIPESVVGIDNSAFHSCYNLTSVTLPSALKTIEWSTFEGCSKLAGVVIPESVTEIKGSAFKRCENIFYISIPSSVAYIKGDAFADCKSFTDFLVDKYNPYFSAVDGILYNKDQTSLVCYPAGKLDNHFSVPYGVAIIENNAFGTCDHLTSVTIPNSVIRIGDWGFSECGNLSSIQMNCDNPPSLGKGVFSGVERENCVVYLPKYTDKKLYTDVEGWNQFKFASK